MVLAHLITLLRKFYRTVFGSLSEAIELRRQLSNRYPLAGE